VQSSVGSSFISMTLDAPDGRGDAVDLEDGATSFLGSLSFWGKWVGMWGEA
jgi:hypothetical protein